MRVWPTVASTRSPGPLPGNNAPSGIYHPPPPTDTIDNLSLLRSNTDCGTSFGATVMEPVRITCDGCGARLRVVRPWDGLV